MSISFFVEKPNLNILTIGYWDRLIHEGDMEEFLENNFNFSIIDKNYKIYDNVDEIIPLLIDTQPNKQIHKNINESDEGDWNWVRDIPPPVESFFVVGKRYRMGKIYDNENNDMYEFIGYDSDMVSEYSNKKGGLKFKYGYWDDPDKLKYKVFYLTVISKSPIN